MSLQKFILLSAIASALPVQAATEFPEGLVPVEIVSELLGGGTLYRGLPDDFPPLLLPDDVDLYLLATHQRNSYSQSLLLRSNTERLVAHERLYAALTAQGWLDVSTSPFGISGLSLMRLCHDQYGDMTINISTAGSGSRLEVSRTVLPAGYVGMSCAEQLARSQAGAARYALYESVMPLLEVPDNTIETIPTPFLRGFSSGISGSRVEITRDGSIEVPDTNAAELYTHFAAQMQEQGWEADSSDSGNASASSVWTRSIVPDGSNEAERVLLTLTVLQGTGDYYEVSLSLRSPAEGGGAGIGSWISTF